MRTRPLPAACLSALLVASSACADGDASNFGVTPPLGGGGQSDDASPPSGDGGGATGPSNDAGVLPAEDSGVPVTIDAGVDGAPSSDATADVLLPSPEAGSEGGIPTMPSTLKGYWYWGYQGPSIATVQSSAPEANYLAWFAAVGTGSGGTVTFNGIGTPSASDIAAWKAAGKIVTMTIGGSAADLGSSATLTLESASDLSDMVASISSMVTTYGFQGIDVDLENDSGQWTVPLMTSLFAQLKAKFGAGFLVDLDPAPYQIRDSGGIYAQLYASAGANIDLVSPQWYSQCNQSDDWFVNSYILSDLAAITGSVGVPASKILLGAADNNGDCGAPGGAATYFSAFDQWNAAHPNDRLRGTKWFHTGSDQSQGWSYGQGAQ